MDDGLIECRLCGKRWRSLGHHLRWKHGVGADEYRDQHGIRRGQPLTSSSTQARMGDALRRTIAAGMLDRHYAGNKDRARVGAEAARAVLSELRKKGVSLPRGRAPRLSYDRIAAVVVAVEAGTKVATAVKRGGMAYSGYHAALARHPDLKARHDQARAR